MEAVVAAATGEVLCRVHANIRRGVGSCVCTIHPAVFRLCSICMLLLSHCCLFLSLNTMLRHTGSCAHACKRCLTTTTTTTTLPPGMSAAAMSLATIAAPLTMTTWRPLASAQQGEGGRRRGVRVCLCVSTQCDVVCVGRVWAGVTHAQPRAGYAARR